MNKELQKTYQVRGYANYSNPNVSCGTSEEWYTVEHLLKVVDDAGDWNDEVIEDTYTAADVIYTLAYWYDVDTDTCEGFEEVQDAVEAAIAAKGSESDE
jgi:hypothetical protein